MTQTMTQENPSPSVGEPIVLYDDAGKPFGVMCQKCRGGLSLLSTFGNGPNALATAIRLNTECCQPKVCERCGAPRDGYRLLCMPCLAIAEREKLVERLEKARKVALADYDGQMVSDGDDWFRDTSSVDPEDDAEYFLSLPDGTRFVWGTSSSTPKVVLERELEDWLQESHEDASDWVDYPKLAEAQKLVDEALNGVVTYWPDETVAVLIPDATESEGTTSTEPKR